MVGSIRWTRWPLALLAALFSLSIGWSSALAAPKDKVNKALEQSLVRAKKSLLLQDAHLTRVAAFADKVATAIDKAKEKGKDTTAIEQALATFRQQIAAARADWQAASSALSTHDGFDGQGKVTNAETARATIKTARDAMLKAHNTVKSAGKTMRDALKAFRKANRTTGAPDVPADPAAPITE